MFIQQISVFIENRHGSLSDFTQLLGVVANRGTVFAIDAVP